MFLLVLCTIVGNSLFIEYEHEAFERAVAEKLGPERVLLRHFCFFCLSCVIPSVLFRMQYKLKKNHGLLVIVSFYFCKTSIVNSFKHLPVIHTHAAAAEDYIPFL